MHFPEAKVGRRREFRRKYDSRPRRFIPGLRDELDSSSDHHLHRRALVARTWPRGCDLFSARRLPHERHVRGHTSVSDL